MQREILDKNPDAMLQVYVVWFSMLFSDSRSRWDDSIMSDPRVIHLWDEERVVGRFFAEQEESYMPISWDSYYLYGPDADWGEGPSPLVSWGTTIRSRGAQLREDLLPLLGN